MAVDEQMNGSAPTNADALRAEIARLGPNSARPWKRSP